MTCPLPQAVQYTIYTLHCTYLHCTISSVHWHVPLFKLNCRVYHLHSTLYMYTLNNILCTLHNIHFNLFEYTHCTVNIDIHCTVNIHIHCTVNIFTETVRWIYMYSVQYRCITCKGIWCPPLTLPVDIIQTLASVVFISAAELHLITLHIRVCQ